LSKGLFYPSKMTDRKEVKAKYFDTVIKLINEYPKILLVNADNVGSFHMQKIRKSIRGEAVLLMGKNTLIRKAIRGHQSEIPALEALLPYIWGNIGLVFTKGDLSVVRNKLLALKVAAPAKVGAVAPSKVIVPKGNTGMEPTKTSFLQALNIASKINKGQIEIVNDVELIKEGDRVGSSEATLLQMLNIKPFSYGLKVQTVYDNGAVYDAKVLDITDGDIVKKFQAGVARVASLSLGLNFPTIASLPHVVANAYKNLMSVAVATNYSFKQVELLKKMLENPDAFRVAAAPVAAETSSKAPAEEKSKPGKDKEEEEEDTGGGMGGLFGDDGW